MSRNYKFVKFVNLTISSLGVFSDEYSTFSDMINDTGIDKKQQLHKIKKMINIAIRATHYIFCGRNMNLDSPDVMQFWFDFLLLVLFFFKSQAAFVNCLYVARFTIVHSKTQIKFPLLLSLSLLLFLFFILGYSASLLFNSKKLLEMTTFIFFPSRQMSLSPSTSERFPVRLWSYVQRVWWQMPVFLQYRISVD